MYNYIASKFVQKKVVPCIVTDIFIEVFETHVIPKLLPENFKELPMAITTQLWIKSTGLSIQY